VNENIGTSCVCFSLSCNYKCAAWGYFNRDVGNRLCLLPSDASNAEIIHYSRSRISFLGSMQSDNRFPDIYKRMWLRCPNEVVGTSAGRGAILHCLQNTRWYWLYVWWLQNTICSKLRDILWISQFSRLEMAMDERKISRDWNMKINVVRTGKWTVARTPSAA